MKRAADTAVMIVCGLALIAAMTPARAEALSDPTKPPSGIDTPAAAAGEAAAPGAGLQTIIRRRGAKPAAVINGEYVVLGGHIGEARVVRIGEDSVTLKSATGTEILKLAPGIDKAPASPGGGEPGRKENQAGDLRK
jgi:hypothetical protein